MDRLCYIYTIIVEEMQKHKHTNLNCCERKMKHTQTYTQIYRCDDFKQTYNLTIIWVLIEFVPLVYVINLALCYDFYIFECFVDSWFFWFVRVHFILGRQKSSVLFTIYFTISIFVCKSFVFVVVAVVVIYSGVVHIPCAQPHFMLPNHNVVNGSCYNYIFELLIFGYYAVNQHNSLFFFSIFVYLISINFLNKIE